MRTITLRNALRLPVFLLLAAVLAIVAAPVRAAESEPILVGRIAHIEGKLLRYIEEEKDWVLTVKDAPFGLEDTLYADDEAKAEFIMPNSTWVRVGEDTQIELIALHEDATTVDVASGLARFYNRSVDGVVKVTTPFGYVVALGDTAFDLYVGDESLEVVAVRGVVDFVHEKTGNKYEVREGGSSLIADSRETAQGNGAVDRAWDDWNADRDSIWAKRLEASRQSAAYLPEPIRDDSYTLEENGRWERVHYEGSYRDLWRPTRVDPGWRPFTAGRWVVYYGDNCWVPDEPFGYVTHHYGSWVYIDSFRAWYWAPPVRRVVVDAPSVSIGFGWYPGRVGWFHSGESIGWVPLAPHEVYYGRRYWGDRRTVLVDNSVNININIGSYRYLDEAVLIRRDHFYGSARYTPYIDRSVNRTVIVNNYQPITVINNTVINNYNTDRRRYAIHDGEIARKPHFTTMQRIETNRALRQDADRQRGGAIKQELNRIMATTQPPQRAEVRPMTLTSRMVEATRVSQPIQEVPRAKKEIKPRDRDRRVEPEQRRTVDSTLFPAQRGPAAGTGRDDRGVDSPRDRGDRRVGQENAAGTRAPAETREPIGRGDRGQDALRPPAQEGERRIRSPRDRDDRQVRPDGPDGAQVREEDRRGPRNVEERRRQREVEQRQQQEVERLRPEQDRSQRDGRQVQPGDPGGAQLREEDRGSSRGPDDRNQSEVRTPGQDNERRVRSPREQDDRQLRRSSPDGGQVRGEDRVAPREVEQRRQQEADQGRDQEMRRQRQEAERQQQAEGRRQQEAEQRKQEDVQRQQQEEGRRRQQEVEQRRQQEADQGRDQEMRRQRQEAEQQQEEGRRRQQEVEQRRQQEAAQGRDQEMRRQRQEAERQQQAEGRRQQEAEQRKQQDVQRQQQEEGRRRQQEAEQRRQQDVQRQQQEEGRRRQQEAEQRRQQDIQRQQQEEGRRRQQEAEQRRQQDIQRQQQEEGRRRQQEAEQRKQQDIHRQQQEEGRRRQQEAEQRKQQDIQRQQQEEGRRRQQEAEQRKRQEAQPQSAPQQQKKSKKQLEEEELLRQQQQQQPHGRNK